MRCEVAPIASEPPGGDAPLVVLSPHFDDAVVGCGGVVAAARDAGRTVRVVTVFAGEADARSVPWWLRPFARHAMRRREDDRALALLGAEAVRLPFVERALRGERPRRPGTVFGAQAQPRPSEVAEIAAAIGELRAGAVLLAPFGIGGHADHVAVFLAALSSWLENPGAGPVRFYEDPYAVAPRARDAHFAARNAPVSSRPVPLRVAALDRAIAWASRGAPSLSSRLPPAARSLAWRIEPVALGDREARKLDAVRAYGSQLAALGGRGWLDVLRSHHARWGSAEPLWEPVATVAGA